MCEFEGQRIVRGFEKRRIRAEGICRKERKQVQSIFSAGCSIGFHLYHAKKLATEIRFLHENVFLSTSTERANDKGLQLELERYIPRDPKPSILNPKPKPMCEPVLVLRD